MVKLISENWAEIQAYAESENSLSPITYMRSYRDSDLLEEINNEGIREANQVKSDFVEGQKNCIRAAIGFQYRLKVDIANCYPSMYTHSVTWAICGKKEAKRPVQVLTKQTNHIRRPPRNRLRTKRKEAQIAHGQRKRVARLPHPHIHPPPAPLAFHHAVPGSHDYRPGLRAQPRSQREEPCELLCSTRDDHPHLLVEPEVLCAALHIQQAIHNLFCM